MPLRMIQVGTGGIGRRWCRDFLPPFVTTGEIEVVAAVDVNPDVLINAKEGLSLSPSRCYTDLETALRDHPADFCTVVVPPAHHEAVVNAGLDHGLHILSEKPIADTFIAACRVAERVRRAGTKMGVTMNHRFDQDKATLRAAIRDQASGELDYVVGRFHDDCRLLSAWGGDFRHTMADPLLIDGAVHHLDILTDLAGAPCDRVYAETWNPRWGAYAGDSQALVTMHFANGRRAFYEGALTNAIQLNGWGREYIRAECECATLILTHRRVERFPYTPDTSRTPGVEGTRRNAPAAGASLLDPSVADRAVHRLAQRGAANGDGGGAQPGIAGNRLRRNREQSRQAVSGGPGILGGGAPRRRLTGPDNGDERERRGRSIHPTIVFSPDCSHRSGHKRRRSPQVGDRQCLVMHGGRGIASPMALSFGLS